MNIPKNIAILGGSSAIGNAVTQLLSQHYPEAQIHCFSRGFTDSQTGSIRTYKIDWQKEDSLKAAAEKATTDTPLDFVFVANGILCQEDIMPEKSLRDLSFHKFNKIFEVNTIIPAMIAKYFIPVLNKKSRSIFAVLSARVGSISDNRLGGWYAYRASKTALNMILKNAAIETARNNKQAIIVGLHPGTVDTNLSRPFQSNVPKEKLFTPEYSAQCLLSVLNDVTTHHTGKVFAWDGIEVPA